MSLLVSLALGVSLARAQQEIEIHYGWGDKIVYLAEPPDTVRRSWREQMGRDVAIGFRYEHCFLFVDGLDFWSWGGRYVLYDDEFYWDFTDQDFARLVGQEQFSTLHKPLLYHLPLGTITVVGLAMALGVSTYLSAQARARRLLKRDQYQEALHIYLDHLPADVEPGPEDKRGALAAGVAYLHEQHGIGRKEAEAHLQLLAAEIDRPRSHELRNQALAYEQEGQWDEAIDFYTQAANLQEQWDPKDHKFLLKCIERVRAKQARS
jgi:tetratricopeptide (TPR) repeat protein